MKSRSGLIGAWERATGVYKRNAKAVALLIGIGTAIAINADSFHIATRLVQDPALRNSKLPVLPSSWRSNREMTWPPALIRVRIVVESGHGGDPLPPGV